METKHELATSQPQEVANPTPTQLLQLAVQQNLDVDKLERLMQLQERFEANNARKFFFEALAQFQAAVPVIKKNRQADYGQGKTKYQYATLDTIIQQIQEHLKNCGLTYRWEVGENEKQVTVTCIITHVAGHFEKTVMTANDDTSGSKNSIQARGSTVTYLQRYTLIGALGLGTTQDDVDAHRKDDQPAALETIANQLALLNSKEELNKYYEQPDMREYHNNTKVLALFTKRKLQIESTTAAKPATTK